MTPEQHSRAAKHHDRRAQDARTRNSHAETDAEATKAAEAERDHAREAAAHSRAAGQPRQPGTERGTAAPQ